MTHRLVTSSPFSLVGSLLPRLRSTRTRLIWPVSNLCRARHIPQRCTPRCQPCTQPILVTNRCRLVVAHSRATCLGSWHVIPPWRAPTPPSTVTFFIRRPSARGSVTPRHEGRRGSTLQIGMGAHLFIARDAGLTAEEIGRIAYGPDAPFWSELEAAMLCAADELLLDERSATRPGMP